MIEARGKGKWLIRIYLGRDAGGKRKYYNETFYAPIKLLAQEREQELTKKLKGQKAGPYDEIMTLGQYIDYFLENIEDTIRSSSLLTYQGYAKKVKPLVGGLLLWTLTAEQLNSNLRGRFDHLAKRSRKNLYDFIRNVVRSAIEAHRAPQDALLGFKIPKAGKKERQVLSDEDMRLIQENAKPYRYGLVIRLLILTGARSGEILGLCEDVLNFDKKTIIIKRTMNLQTAILKEEPKTANSYRTILLDDETMSLIKEHISDRKVTAINKGKRLVFQTETGRPVRYSTIQKTWKSILKKSGLDFVRIHDIRHSVITLNLLFK
mgnify:FL=1